MTRATYGCCTPWEIPFRAPSQTGMLPPCHIWHISTFGLAFSLPLVPPPLDHQTALQASGLRSRWNTSTSTSVSPLPLFRSVYDQEGRRAGEADAGCANTNELQGIWTNDGAYNHEGMAGCKSGLNAIWIDGREDLANPVGKEPRCVVCSCHNAIHSIFIDLFPCAQLGHEAGLYSQSGIKARLCATKRTEF